MLLDCHVFLVRCQMKHKMVNIICKVQRGLAEVRNRCHYVSK